MKPTKREMECFTALVQAVNDAKNIVQDKLDDLTAELESGSDNYEGEEDRDDIGILHDETEELRFNIEDGFKEWVSRLVRFKSRFDLTA